MELASSLVGGAKGDLVDLIYNFIRHTLEVGILVKKNLIGTRNICICDKSYVLV